MVTRGDGWSPDVEEGLVDRDLLDDGRCILQDLHDLGRKIEVSPRNAR